MKKMYNRKGVLIAVSLSIQEQEKLAGINNAKITDQNRKLKELDKWLEEQEKSSTG